ncbi:hypothetical protein J3T79_13660 [Staphylococcus nepalensis]|uniref:hypothetical protein n=1 Tax=Staphylococcus nepalensis TaxID=214473 RepID=UPI001A9969B6|nr:hypothetical protein [Staphylococcus nepalensis]MBO1217475.1 hypothetical protein [Staphylococcus nepalensis]
MGENSERKKNSSVTDAIIGGVFGVTAGLFYKREQTQLILKRIRDSELAKNIAADMRKSAEENLKDFIVMNMEKQKNELFSNKKIIPPLSNEDSDEKNEKKSPNEKFSSNKNESKSYEALKKENKQLEEMISKLEKKFEHLS